MNKEDIKQKIIDEAKKLGIMNELKESLTLRYMDCNSTEEYDFEETIPIINGPRLVGFSDDEI